MNECGLCYEPLEVIAVDAEGVDVLGCPICYAEVDIDDIEDDMWLYI